MFHILRAEGRALVCNFGLNICLDCERHNGPFIQFFFQPLAVTHSFQSSVLQKPFGLWLRLKARLHFFLHTGCFQNPGCNFGSWRVWEHRMWISGRRFRVWRQVLPKLGVWGGIQQVWLHSVLTARLSSPRARLLTGLAVEAAESLVEVLLVLLAWPELSEGHIFAPVAGPLSRRRLCSAAHRQQEQRRDH